MDSLQYAYSGGNLQSVTYRQQVAGGSWTSILRATYTYCGSSDPNGNLNDLQTAAQQIPNGSGGWNTVAVSYYRYLINGAMKMAFGPEAYRLVFNAGINILTASDAAILPYADNYYEYVAGQVSKQISAVCESCGGGGNTTDLFAYSNNPNFPGVSSNYNVWWIKCVQQLPDNSQIVVYSNYFGLPMLYVNVDPTGANMWGTFYRYDVNGQIIWEAEPSAVALPASLSTIEAFNDLLNFSSMTGTYQYLNNTSGLIKVTSYYASTNISLGQVQYYVSARGVMQGQTGTYIAVSATTYTSNTDSSGNTIFPAATEVMYPVAGSTSTTITTSYAYTFVSGTNEMASRTTTPPVIGTGQNGSGSTYTIVETFDSYGNLTSRTDERGIVNTYAFSGLGLVATEVLNYQSGVTQPGVNVKTDFTHDGQGRILQSLGPAHTVVLSGTATSVRKAMFYVYLQSVQPGSGTWAPDQTLVGNGYLASGTYSLINPVSITNADKDGRVTDQITSKRTTGSGALGPTNTFAQSDWQTWSSIQYNNQHQTISSRVYHLIPSSGIGTVGTNFGETDFGYDTLERQNRVVAPGGTITRTVWTTPQRVASVWVGTDDTGATDSNPAGSGSPNNMVIVSANVYDGGGIGDGNPTTVTQYASATDTRVTVLGYDFRDRKISMDGEVDVYEQYTLDNLDRQTQTDRFDTTSAGNLIGRTQAAFDDRSRPYQTKVYAVDPATGTIGNALIGNSWYDPSGNLFQEIAPGDGIVFKKSVYNGVNWVISSYRGYNASGTSYSQAGTVANDTIMEQADNTYDEAGNTVSVAMSQRLNDTPATGTGSTGALSYGTQPKARVMYMASWFDGIDRPIASANYGAIASFTRPSTPPASSSTVLVTATSYDNAGRVYQVTDPMGYITQTSYDNANRTTQTIEALGLSVARTTNYTYTLDNLTATMTAVNSGTGNQTTTWTYGTTLSTSGVARNDLLASVTYPDSVSGSDQVSYTYNRLSEQATIQDQRGNVRTISRDKLGRETDDGVTTLASGTDGTVRRISRAYEVRGMVNLVSSYDNATPGSGTMLNQCKLTFNTFGQLSKEQQEHSGAVTSGSLNVQYGYDTGASSSNQIRPNLLTYPNNRAITFSFGTSGGMNDLLNRVDTIEDTTSGTTNLASYSYLGIGTPILIDYPQPQVKLDLWGGTSGTFTGLDLFNRIASQGWVNYNTSRDVFRLNHGYDRNSNRLYAQNTTQKGASQAYTNDQLNRLLTYKAGMIKSDLSDIAPNWTLDATRWTLDPTGNQTAVDYPNSFGSNSFAWLNWFQNTANTVNEYTTRKSYSGSKGRIWDKFTANTTANWSSPGSSVTFTVSTSSQTLTVNTIGQDTIDGYLEPQAQALILTGEAIGPTIPGVTFVIPTGTTTGQVGLVFGYKSGADYWLWARDMNGTAKIYHVQNGVSTQVASTTYPAPVAGTATGAFFIGGWSFSEYAPAYSFGTSGFPSGKIGFYTNIAGVAFSSFSSWEQAPVHLNGRWINDASYAVNLTTDQSLTVSGNAADEYNAILLENLRLKKFQATFALTRATGQSQSLLGLIFNAADRGNYNYVSITHTGTVINPIGYIVAPSSAPATASGGSNPSNIPTCAATDTLWCRAQNDGTTFTLKCINSSTAPSEATWSSTTACYSNASLANIGGQIGFNCNQGIGYISQFTLKSWNTTTSAFDITEHWDNFNVDSSGFANETPTYDAAGNLTYDGRQFYTWDAWNRLMTIAHAYRDSGGTLQHGQVFDTMAYDGRNRRIQKTVSNTGQWDCNYNYYYTNGWQLIETRNGSSQTLKQHVWGIRYIDELIQVAANSNPTASNTCSGWFYAMQDANFNVLGLVNSSGNPVERYEYTPYGQRKVLFAAGNTWAGGTSTNDPGCYAIAYASLRYTSNAPYFGLCDIGHQGLMQDEENGLTSNRRRAADKFAFTSRDVFFSHSAYAYQDCRPNNLLDPSGEQAVLPPNLPGFGDYGLPHHPPVELPPNFPGYGDFGPPHHPPDCPPQPTCGPEITESVSNMLSDLSRQFAMMSPAKQALLCQGCFDQGHWDSDLFTKYFLFTSPSCNATGPCAAGLAPGGKGAGVTGGVPVTVNGACHASFDVNYALYGRLAALCNANAEASAKFIAYKSSHSFTRFQNAGAWKIYGQAGGWVLYGNEYSSCTPCSAPGPQITYRVTGVSGSNTWIRG